MCNSNDICPVHGRNDVKDPVESGLAARAVTYLGDVAVVTSDNPEYMSPMASLKSLFGMEMPNMFMHMVVRVGEGTLGDVLDAGTLAENTIFRETFLSIDDERVTPYKDGKMVGVVNKFNEKLTEIMHESHDLVVDSVRNKVIG